VNFVDPSGLKDASAGDIVIGVVTAPAKGMTVLTEIGKNAPEVVEGVKAIKKRLERNKRFEDCCKDKNKTRLECQIDYWGSR